MNRLAETAADAELLAASLARHHQMCGYPTLKAGLQELAASQTIQAKAICGLLLELGMQPNFVSQPPHDGSSNWERLRNDLSLQVKIQRALQSQLAEWTPLDPQIAQRLQEPAVEAERQIERLRDLTLKCDPQALD